MLLLVLMIFSVFEKTFCKVFVTFVICTARQLICSLCCTWNDVQTFSNGIGECHKFDNTLYLCNTSNNNDIIVTINVQKSRSRYAKYLYYNCARVVCECHRYKRDREQSRIPEKKLRSLTRKNRNLQCYVRHRVLKNIPESSKVHRIILGVEARIKPKKRIRQRKYKAFLQTSKGKVYIRKYRNISHSHDFKKVAIWFNLFSHNNFLPNEYRNANHKGKYSKYNLSNDIEKNPGPAIYYVDPSKTIRAPYSQGNVHIFGVNAGQQCVAMSLCALIYHNMRGINSSNDLLKTMHIGNELYSSLSQLARQSFLMLIELPAMLTMLDKKLSIRLQC